jgi:hypothetical protein
MKKQNLFATALLALAGAAFLTPFAHADTSTITPATTCDMILGFRVATLYDDSGNALAAQGIGTSSNLEIDLGSASQFYNATAGTSFTLTGRVLADLVATYGANWSTRTDLFWGVIGTTGRSTGSGVYVSGSLVADGHASASTIWATKAEETPGVQSTPWNRSTTFSQAIPISKIEPLYVGTAPLVGATSTDNSSTAAVISTSVAGSWTSQDLYASTSKSFGYFGGTIDNTTAISIGNYSVLDLYELTPGSGAGTLLGAFGLDSTGTLTFSTDISDFAVVPEPSSLALLGIAGCAFALRHRRQRKSAVA